MPFISAVYGLALIYLTALPIADGGESLAKEALTWFLTLAAIALTVCVVIPIERKIYPESRQFSLKPPTLAVAVGLILIAPLWLVTQEAVVYGLTSMIHSVQTELLVYSSEDFREDMLASVHAVLLAPVLEELCYRLPIQQLVEKHLVRYPASRRQQLDWHFARYIRIPWFGQHTDVQNSCHFPARRQGGHRMLDISYYRWLNIV